MATTETAKRTEGELLEILKSSQLFELMDRLEKELFLLLGTPAGQKRLGDNINILRAYRGWQTQELADKSQLDRGFISRLQIGGCKVRIRNLICIATALGVKVTTLMREDVMSEFQELVRRLEEKQTAQTTPAPETTT